MPRAPAVGIDLGTTNSCVAIYLHEEVEIITNEHGNKTTPSYVAFTEEGRLIGQEAKNQQPVNPENTVFDCKRLIGRKFADNDVRNDIKTWPFKVVDDNQIPKIKVKVQGKDKLFAPEQISSMVLEKLKETAEAYLGMDVVDAVVTVPAYFNDSQRQATRDAGKIAGLNVLRVLSEPTAAAVAYGLDKICRNQKSILVFDLGGGTFDVSVLTINDGIFDVKATFGDTHLGGEDFDSRLVTYCIEECKKKHRRDLKNNQNAIGRIRAEVEKAKRTLSQTSSTKIEIDALDGFDFQCNVTRDQFEKLNEDLFQKTINCVKTALELASVSKEDIDDIVMVGGSSRIPKIQNMVENYFGGKRLSKSIHPDEAVAHGACLVASSLSGSSDGRVQDIVLKDVIPLSLGLEVRGAEMSVIIKRNTQVPTKAKDNFTTMYDQQTRIHCKVYEGERPLTKDNLLLGDFLLTGIPPGAPGDANVVVTFEVDEDAILHARAELQGATRSSAGITIENDKGRLSEEELHRMILEAQEFQAEDEIERARIAAKNKLETLAFNLKSFINRGKIQVSDKALIMKECEKVSAWILDNEDADQREYETRTDNLEEICRSQRLDTEEVISGRLPFKT